MLNKDFSDMLSLLGTVKADFLIVGAYALAAHGLPRATGDLDIWVRPTEENSRKVWEALCTFGAPRSRISSGDFAAPDVVFQIGLAPRRIDILTSISGVTFDDAWQARQKVVIDNMEIGILSRSHLIQNKRACGRPKDLADLDWLEKDADG